MSMDYRTPWQPDDPGVGYRRAGNGDFLTRLSDAARENPVPAALISMGVLWMFMGGSATSILGGGTRLAARGLRYGGGAAYGAAQGVGSAVAGGAGYAADTLSSVASGAAGVAGSVGSALSVAASRAADVASNAYDAAGSVAGRAIGSVAGTAGDLAGQAQEGGRDWAHAAHDTGSEWARSAAQSGHELGNTLQQNLSELFERQPLLLGAVGLAVGAAIAAALPRTETEARYLGEASDALKEQAQELVSGATDQAKQMAQRAVEEAAGQGLTGAAAGAALRGVVDKVSGLAQGARDSAAENLQGSGSSRGGAQPRG